MIRYYYCCLILITLSACAYRAQSAPQIDEAVSIHINSNTSRFPLIQGPLHQALGQQLRQDLAWTIHPNGPAQLQLSLNRDKTASSSTQELGIPDRWGITMSGTWQLSTSTGTVYQGPFTGSGFYGNRIEEQDALQDIAEAIADTVVQSLQFAVPTAVNKQP